MSPLVADLAEFIRLWWQFCSRHTKSAFESFEAYKKRLAELLYRQRGKFARPFVHSGMVTIAAMGVMLAPVISEEFPDRRNILAAPSPSSVLSAATESPLLATLVSSKYRDKTIDYKVQEGDTVSVIAEKFGVSQETIIWENELPKKAVLKPGQTIRVLPVTGVSHKVNKGETIYSIAKRYNVDPQPIVDFPYNTFVNDETFALAVGQVLIIPDGVLPKEAPPPSRFARRTPDAGTVAASGEFVWPAAGDISQGFAFYHKGIDIANRAAPEILAADSGAVVVAGCVGGGYGCHVIVDHGNGFRTLYGHLGRIYVEAGQTVKRGSTVGKMGSTGRSTGVHLHFELHKTGVAQNPLDYLR